MELVRRNNGEIQGVKFGKGSDSDEHWYEFNGSKVGKKYSFGNIDMAQKTGMASTRPCNTGPRVKVRGTQHPIRNLSLLHSVFSHPVSATLHRRLTTPKDGRRKNLKRKRNVECTFNNKQLNFMKQ